MKKTVEKVEISKDNDLIDEFDGVFRFSNSSDEDFEFLWNNKEYIFPAHSRCPMVIANETSENIQEIRKKAAYKFAQRELLKSKKYHDIEKVASKHVSPATYDENILDEYIKQCLSPLPIASAKSVAKKVNKPKFIDEGTAVIGGNQSISALSSAEGAFKSYVPQEMGKMS